MSSKSDAMGIPHTGQRVAEPLESAFDWRPSLVWLVAALSSIVFIEPAPYDLLVVGSLAAFLITGMRIPRQLGVPVLLLVLFLLGNWAASVVSLDPGSTLKSLGIRVYLCASVVLFACVVAFAPDRMLRALWHGYTVAALIAIAWASLEYFGLLSRPAELRAQGPFEDPNVYGPFLVPIALRAVEAVAARRGAAQYGTLGLFLAAVFGILISFSRGAWLNLVVSMTVYLGLKVFVSRSVRHQMRHAIIGLALLVAAAGLVSWAVTSTPVGDRFVQRARLFHEYDLAPGGRFDAQTKSLQAAANPLGLGPGRSDEQFGREPHNLYLHVISEGGWLAAFGFFSFLALTLAKSARLVRSQWALQSQLHIVLAALTGTLLQSFFIDSTHWRHLYLLLAILWGLFVVHSRGSRGARHSGPRIAGQE